MVDASHLEAIWLSILITFDAFCARNFFQSGTASLLVLSDKKAHSGFGLRCSLDAWIQADAYSRNVGALPLLQNSLATILAMAPFFKLCVGQTLKKGDHDAVCLVVLPIKQSIVGRNLVRKPIKTNNRVQERVSSDIAPVCRKRRTLSSITPFLSSSLVILRRPSLVSIAIP